jgi:oligosaccharyl transferase complex subunit OST4
VATTCEEPTKQSTTTTSIAFHTRCIITQSPRNHSSAINTCAQFPLSLPKSKLTTYTPEPPSTYGLPTQPTTNQRATTHGSYPFHQKNETTPATMITDNQLYSLALFLGAASMLLIILYHFLEVNAKDSEATTKTRKADASKAKVRSA